MRDRQTGTGFDSGYCWPPLETQLMVFVLWNLLVWKGCAEVDLAIS